MYQPKKYKKQDPDYIYQFIEEHPFATIVLHGERLLATNIPVLIEGTPKNFKLFSKFKVVQQCSFIVISILWLI